MPAFRADNREYEWDREYILIEYFAGSSPVLHPRVCAPIALEKYASVALFVQSKSVESYPSASWFITHWEAPKKQIFLWVM